VRGCGGLPAMREQRDARGFSGLMRWNEISTVNEVLSIRSAD